MSDIFGGYDDSDPYHRELIRDFAKHFPHMKSLTVTSLVEKPSYSWRRQFQALREKAKKYKKEEHSDYKVPEMELTYQFSLPPYAPSADLK